jgi:release factor glutamine methyltransferase
MLSLIEILKKTEAYFREAEIENPKVEAEWLLAEFLGLKRLELFLQHDRLMEEEKLVPLRGWVKRRAEGEPLAYITGRAAFHGIELEVGPGVLIPRPETEQLVEQVCQECRDQPNPRIIDLGTGSGAIALALASAFPASKVLAIDASTAALAQAKANAERLGLRGRVAFRKGNWLEKIQTTADIIVANPPYLTEAEWASARPEVRDHEPREALVAADAGLSDLQQILKSALPCLAQGGLLAMETGICHGDRLEDLAVAAGYADVALKNDDSGRQRFLFARSPRLDE